MLSARLVHVLVTAVALLVTGHALEACAGLQGPPGNNGLPGLPGKQGEKGAPGKAGLPASQDVQLQNNLKELKYRISRLERALALNGKIAVAGKKLFATTEKTADFDDTVRICKSAHGSIASPGNMKENDAIMSFVKEFNTYAYLGITEGHVPGEFHFLNGTTLNFTNWYKDEPQGKGAEKCVEMYSDGTWNDKLCNKFRLIVCEF